MRGGYPKGKPLLRASLAAASSGCRGLLCIRRCQTTVEIDDQCAVTRARSSCSSISLQLLAGQLDEARRLSVLLDSTAEDMGEESCAQKSVRHNLLDDRKRTCSPHRQQRPAPAKIGRRFMLGEQMLDADFPVAGDVRHRRAAIDRQIAAERPGAAADELQAEKARDAEAVVLAKLAEVQVRRLRILRCDRRRARSESGPEGRRSSHGSGSESFGSCPRVSPRPACSGADRHYGGRVQRLPRHERQRRSSPHAGRQEVPWTPDLGLRAERQPIARESRAFLDLEGFAAGVILGFHIFSIQYWNISIQF